MNYYVKEIFTFFTFLTTKAATVGKILLKFLKKLEKSQQWGESGTPEGEGLQRGEGVSSRETKSILSGSQKMRLQKTLCEGQHLYLLPKGEPCRVYRASIFSYQFSISCIQGLLAYPVSCIFDFYHRQLAESLILFVYQKMLICSKTISYFPKFFNNFMLIARSTAQKVQFFIKDFFSRCDQIRRKLRIWSHLLKKSLMQNFIFCAMAYFGLRKRRKVLHLQIIN